MAYNLPSTEQLVTNLMFPAEVAPYIEAAYEAEKLSTETMDEFLARKLEQVIVNEYIRIIIQDLTEAKKQEMDVERTRMGTDLTTIISRTNRGNPNRGNPNRG